MVEDTSLEGTLVDLDFGTTNAKVVLSASSLSDLSGYARQVSSPGRC